MTALDHVGLSVGNLEAQTRWYVDAFGLRVANPFRIDAVGLAGAFVVHESGWAIELLQRDGSSGTPFDHPNSALLTRGFGHICVRVDDVDATHARLLDHGAGERMAPQDAPEPGVRMSFLADPEGNLIELLDRAGSVGS